MSDNVHVLAPAGVAPGNGYSQVAWGTGRLITVAGQIALDEHGELVGVGDPAAQAEQVFENIRRCLVAAGAGFDDVLKLTFFLTDLAHLPAIRAARDAVFDAERLPTCSALVVAALVRPEFLFEIEALAVVPATAGQG
ncbi:RidA family protein [Kitasatospora sp. NBC_01250]|uniref:RidA family protein n=1 Tax=unclassified Kitasatospora TaxID=2633591 RepID=UPI002E143F08|nr:MULTISPECIES: RidA family protein [unclassified Kitasatospora]WSJ66364.1 RidA family protein [Kitasatospora sp. NBC_01302]